VVTYIHGDHSYRNITYMTCVECFAAADMYVGTICVICSIYILLSFVVNESMHICVNSVPGQKCYYYLVI